MKQVTTAIVLAAAITTTAQAQLQHKDNFTRDTDTGLDWLDLADTAGRSVNQVLSGAGGFTDAGWRLATEVEVFDFLSRHFFNGNASTETIDPYLSDAEFAQAQGLMKCLGALQDVNTPGSVPGTFTDSGLPISAELRGWYEINEPGFAGKARAVVAPLVNANQDEFSKNYASWDAHNFSYNYDRTDIFVGVFMVRDSAGRIRHPKKHRCEPN